MKNQSAQNATAPAMKEQASPLRMIGVVGAAVVVVGMMIAAGVAVTLACIAAVNDQYIDSHGVMMSVGARPRPVATAKVVKSMDLRNLTSQPTGTLRHVVLKGFGEQKGKGIQHTLKVSSITQIGTTERYVYFKPNPVAKYLRITKSGVQIISDSGAVMGKDGRRLQRTYEESSVPYEIDEALFGLTDPETYAFELALDRMKSHLLESHEAWKNAETDEEKESLAYATEEIMSELAPDAFGKVQDAIAEADAAVEEANRIKDAAIAEANRIKAEAEAELQLIQDEALAKVNAFNEEKNYYYTPLEQAQLEWMAAREAAR